MPLAPAQDRTANKLKEKLVAGVRLVEQTIHLLLPDEREQLTAAAINAVVRYIYVACAQISGYKSKAPRQEVLDLFEGMLRMFQTLKAIDKIKPAAFLRELPAAAASVVAVSHDEAEVPSGVPPPPPPPPPPPMMMMESMPCTPSRTRQSVEPSADLDKSILPETSAEASVNEADELLCCAIFDACKLLMERIVERARPTLVSAAGSSPVASPSALHRKSAAKSNVAVGSPSITANGSAAGNKSVMLWLMFGCKFVNKALEMMGPERFDDERVLGLVDALQHLEDSLPDL